MFKPSVHTVLLYIVLFSDWKRNEWRRTTETCTAVWRISKETGATKRRVRTHNIMAFPSGPNWPTLLELIPVSVAWSWLHVVLSIATPPGWDASPTPGYHQAFCYIVGCPNSLPVPKNTTQWPQPGLGPGPLDLESIALTIRPPHLMAYQHIHVNMNGLMCSAVESCCHVSLQVQDCSSW